MKQKVWYQCYQIDRTSVYLACSLDNKLFLGLSLNLKGWKRPYLKNIVTNNRAYVTVLSESTTYIETRNKVVIEKLKEVQQNYRFLLF